MLLEETPLPSVRRVALAVLAFAAAAGAGGADLETLREKDGWFEPGRDVGDQLPQGGGGR